MIYSWSASDPEGQSLSCSLDVDSDGTAEYALSDCGSVAQRSHIYANEGSFVATLLVKDALGASVSATVSVSVQPIEGGVSRLEVVGTTSTPSLVEPGGAFLFSAEVTNPSGADVATVTGIDDAYVASLAVNGQCEDGGGVAVALPYDLDPGGAISCTFEVEHTGNAGDSFAHRVTVSAIDDDGADVGGISNTVSVGIEQAGTFEAVISAPSHDVEERDNGSFVSTSDDLELTFDPTLATNQIIGLRFVNIGIPTGATITNAYVQFTVDGVSTDATSLTIQAEAVDNASAFNSSNRPSSRTWTSSSVSWTPEVWLNVAEAGPAQRTPNLAAVLREVVHRPGWQPGNALAIFITGTGHREAVSFDGDPAGAPRLVVEYTTDAQSVTVAAAGDISCDPSSTSFNGGDGTATSCRMKAVAELMQGMDLDAVFTLGDNQYEDGTLDKFMASYDLSWGRFKGMTYPAPGNHEYYTSGATGYYDYFGSAAGDRSKGYYSFDLGSWHIVVLNSDCSRVGGCGVGSAQEQWLRADLAANPTACTLAYWHHPRFSSGMHGNHSEYVPFWEVLYEHGAELVLTSHDHNYERFAPQDASGVADSSRGIRQFVVGTGGKSLRSLAALQPNSEVFDGDTFGVLKLTLHPGSYDWEFVPEPGGGFSDAGSGVCH
ncbi:MAG: metallophosphoesterase [Trueperaceae bacterium]|nr:MAG: metallophosphoesterase [Trueperaceae bacterium]